MEHVFETDAYFCAAPQKLAPALFVLRELFFELFPATVENMEAQQVTYYVNEKPLFALAYTHTHICFRVLPYDLLLAYENQLEDYIWEKDSIYLTKLCEDDFLLLREICEFINTHFAKSKLFKKAVVPQIATII